MEASRAINIDSPTLDDRLGFDIYARGIARTIRDASYRNQLPLTIGIYGRWGAGKTSLMKMVEAELAGTASPGLQGELDALVLQLSIRRLWITQAVWAGLLVAAVAFGPWATSLLHSRFHLMAEAAAFGYLWGLLAWLGGFARGLFATWWQGYVEKRLVSGGVWIAARGPQGLLLGLAALVLVSLSHAMLQRILQSGVLSVAGYILACAIGFFASEIVRAPRRLWSRLRPPSATSPSPAPPQFQVIWFDAWKYAQEEELWATLLQRLLTELKINAAGKKRVRIKWELWKRSIEWKSGALDMARKLLPTVGKIVGSLGVGGVAFWLSRLLWPAAGQDQLKHAASTAAGLLSTAGTLAAWLHTNVATPLADVDFEKYRKKASYRDHLTFLTEFGEELKAIVTITRDVGNPVVVMLDDLDRCLPEQAVSVLEAIKLFVSDEAPVVFVVGADREFIERSIDVMYAALKDKDDPYAPRKERFAQLGREYLEKIVQLPFNLPPIDLARIDTFIDERFAEDTMVTENSQIFAAGLLANPRQVVRAVSTFRFVAGLADENGAFYAKTIVPAILAKLVVIQYRWSDLYAELVDRPALLQALEQYFGGNLPSDDAMAGAVEQYASKSGLRQMLTLPPSVVGADLSPYLFITARAHEQAQSAAGIATPPPASLSSAAAPVSSAAPSLARVAPGTASAVPVPPAATPPTAAPAPTFSSSDMQRFSELLIQLKDHGGDSALFSRLFDSNNRIQSYLSSNSIEAAQKTLTESLSVAERALQELEEKSATAVPAINVEVSRDGTLQFQRALTYSPLEILIREEAGKPEVRCTILDRGRQVATWSTRFPTPDLLNAAKSYNGGAASEEQVKLLGKGLVSEVLKLLPSTFDIRSSRRLHVISTPAMDELPWELMFVGATEDSIGLDPRHCLVRGHPDQTSARGTMSFPISILLIGFEDASFQAQAYLNDLNSAFLPLSGKEAVRTSVVEAPTVGDILDSLSKEGPQIVHIAASNGASFLAGDDVLFPVVRPGVTPSIKLADLGKRLQESGVRLIFLDVPQSRALARELARYVPAVVGFQTTYPVVGPNFVPEFYTAFLRTGQADFAVTQARRAIWSWATGANAPARNSALAPVLYQAPGSGLIFEPATTASPSRGKAS